MLQLRSSYHSTLICRENCKTLLRPFTAPHCKQSSGSPPANLLSQGLPKDPDCQVQFSRQKEIPSSLDSQLFTNTLHPSDSHLLGYTFCNWNLMGTQTANPGKSDRNPKVTNNGPWCGNEFGQIFCPQLTVKQIHALIWPFVFSPSMASRAKSRDWLWNWDLVLPSHQFQGLEDFFPPILWNGEKQARGEAGPMFQQFGSNFKALLQLLF